MPTPEATEATTPKADTVVSSDDPFDLSKLRLDQSFVESAGVKKLLTTMPVRKPNPQDFVRVHPDEDHGQRWLIDLKEDREIYLLPPHVAKQLPGEFVMDDLHHQPARRCVLWPVRFPASDGRTRSGTVRRLKRLNSRCSAGYASKPTCRSVLTKCSKRGTIPTRNGRI